jgi:hypothetical protein
MPGALSCCCVVSSSSSQLLVSGSRRRMGEGGENGSCRCGAAAASGVGRCAALEEDV